MAEILVADLTDGKIDGDGVFDKLMSSVGNHINVEREANRISNTDYSTVYLGAMQAALAQSVQFVLGRQVADKQADLYAQKIVTELTQTQDSQGGTTKKQQTLIQAQTDGFARDAEQKLSKIVSDAYAVQRTTDSGLAPPSTLAEANINQILDIAKEGIL